MRELVWSLCQAFCFAVFVYALGFGLITLIDFIQAIKPALR